MRSSVTLISTQLHQRINRSNVHKSDLEGYSFPSGLHQAHRAFASFVANHSSFCWRPELPNCKAFTQRLNPLPLCSRPLLVWYITTFPIERSLPLFSPPTLHNPPSNSLGTPALTECSPAVQNSRLAPHAHWGLRFGDASSKVAMYQSVTRSKGFV